MRPGNLAGLRAGLEILEGYGATGLRGVVNGLSVVGLDPEEPVDRFDAARLEAAGWLYRMDVDAWTYPAARASLVPSWAR